MNGVELVAYGSSAEGSVGSVYCSWDQPTAENPLDIGFPQPYT